jgi:hypothetical protein
MTKRSKTLMWGCLTSTVLAGLLQACSSAEERPPPAGTPLDASDASSDGGTVAVDGATKRDAAAKDSAAAVPPPGGFDTGPDAGATCLTNLVENGLSASCTVGFGCVAIKPSFNLTRKVACDGITCTCTTEDGTVTTFPESGFCPLSGQSDSSYPAVRTKCAWP